MNLLTTICRATEQQDTWTIFWRNGVQKQGQIQVTVTTAVDDREIIAELSAIQWLLEHRSIFGVSQAGKGVCLTVSAGAIKKLARAAAKSSDLRESDLTKQHLFPYARYLGTRFVGMQVVVSKEDDWIKPRSESDVSELTVDAPLPEILDIRGIGLVELTAHALQQFAKRQGASDREEAWRLLRRVAESGLERVDHGDASRKDDAERNRDAGEVWVNKETKWAFVIVRTGSRIAAVTAYATKQSRM
jgi:hypothetical protein